MEDEENHMGHAAGGLFQEKNNSRYRPTSALEHECTRVQGCVFRRARRGQRCRGRFTDFSIIHHRIEWSIIFETSTTLRTSGSNNCFGALECPVAASLELRAFN